MKKLLTTLLLLLVMSSVSNAQLPVDSGNCWINQVTYEIIIDFGPPADFGGYWFMVIDYNGEYTDTIVHQGSESIVIDMNNVYLTGYCYVHFLYLNNIGQVIYTNPDLLLF